MASESRLELSFSDGKGTFNVFPVTYAAQGDLILEEFGLEFDGNGNIISKVCNEYTFAPNKGIALAESNFCTVDDPLEAIKAKFMNNNFSSGDTLGLCLVKKIYRKAN